MDFMLKQTKKDKILLIVSSIFLTTASILSFILTPETRSIIPYPGIVIPIINTSSALTCIVSIFIPRHYKIPAYIVTFVQAISTTLTGYETLGIILYAAGTSLLFCDGFFKKHYRKKIIVLFCVWFSSLFGIIPFGWHRVILAIATSVFYLVFNLFVADRLSQLLAPLLPSSNLDSLELKVKLPRAGETVSLTKLGLTKRQAEFVISYITNGYTYTMLADQFITSISTIKGEMAATFKIFGVKNKEELRIILMQYELTI